MTQVTCSPSKYIQGIGEISKLGDYCVQLGAKGAVAIVDPFILTRYKEEIEHSFVTHSVPLVLIEFKGECSRNQVEHILQGIDPLTIGVILGIGGGKTMDTAKAVSHYASLPVIIVPTVASTDAPCSALAVLYTDDGDFDSYLPLLRNPDVVIADVEIIAKAPARLLAAGMGDALSTYYEARACRSSGARTYAGGTSSLAALSLAKTCLEIILSEGESAMNDVRLGECTPAVEHIIEANIYLSGVGFESGGLAAAHAIHNGLSLLEECRGMLHGEKVAFATIAQLILEQAPDQELDRVINFCRRVGLPVTLKELGLSGIERNRLMLAAEASCTEESPMQNMPFPIHAIEVLEAILEADRRGSL